jgi:tetraacyldisaccharide 4'-kinase
MRTPSFWQSHNAISTLLLPASWAYRTGAWLDRHFTTPRHAPLPVISIGNAVAGGAGKTPTTLALVPLLRALGHTPHILTRGYKGAALTAHRVTADDSWQQVGDEALLLANAAPTWVGRDRLASARAAANAGATILLCDDALQHHALHKTISLLVIDGPYGNGNGRVLPAGPLRETLASAAKRADAAIIIGDDTHQLTAQLRIPIIAANLQPAGDGSFLRNGKWLAFAGIGRPEKFFATLKSLGATLAATRSFADHHAYSERDITQLLGEAKTLGARLITTAKDAVKLPAALREQLNILPVELVWNDPASLQNLLKNSLATQQPS